MLLLLRAHLLLSGRRNRRNRRNRCNRCNRLNPALLSRLAQMGGPSSCPGRNRMSHSTTTTNRMRCSGRGLSEATTRDIYVRQANQVRADCGCTSADVQRATARRGETDGRCSQCYGGVVKRGREPEPFTPTDAFAQACGNFEMQQTVLGERRGCADTSS